MVEVGSWWAKDSAPRVQPRGLLGCALSGRKVAAIAAALALLGCLSFSQGAYAQATTSTQAAAAPDACLAKCKADDAQCYQNGSSEELCAYDLRTCKAACEKK